MIIAFLGAIFCFILISLLWKWANSDKIELSNDKFILQDLHKNSNEANNEAFNNTTISSLSHNIYH